MESGMSTQLTGKIGEFLVAAELARRKIMATPFSGNVPEIDILGYANGTAVPIQVKTINGDSWQFDIRKFLNIEISDGAQVVLGSKRDLNRQLICIFVTLGESLSDAEFYVLRYGWLQDHFLKNYKGRTRPKNINSYHCAIWKKEMKQHLSRWGIIERRFRLTESKNEK